MQLRTTSVFQDGLNVLSSKNTCRPLISVSNFPRVGATFGLVFLWRPQAALSDAVETGNALHQSYPCFGRLFAAKGGILRRS